MVPSNLFSPGTKISVTADFKLSSAPPNSSAFVSHMYSFNKQRAMIPTMVIVVVRRGKRGKHRIEKQNVNVLTFPTKEALENMNKNPMGMSIINYKRAKNVVSSVHQMTGVDFLGWALSYVLYLARVHSQTGEHITWPGEKQNPVNLVHNTIPSRFPSHPGEVMENFGENPEFRVELITAIRSLEAAMVKSAFTWRHGVAECELISAAEMLRTHILTKGKMYKEKELESLYDFHARKFLKIQQLLYELNLKRYQKFSEVDGGNVEAYPPEYGYDVKIFKSLKRDIEANKNTYAQDGSQLPIFATKKKEPKVNKENSLSSFLV